MAVRPIHPTQDTILDFLVEKASPEEILAFELPEDLRQHLIEMLDKQDEGTLSPEETAELESHQQMDLFLMALRTRARIALRNRK